ncbi:MAG TPA: hypothetical protein VK648_00140, partial [Gemmatimonadaceae bacterium]|nr:hypothetical protein [Gemmatimonadaceae bacterium]
WRGGCSCCRIFPIYPAHRRGISGCPALNETDARRLVERRPPSGADSRENPAAEGGRRSTGTLRVASFAAGQKQNGGLKARRSLSN